MSPSKKHILFLTWKDIHHPHAGGAERVMYEYAKRFADDGHQVTWFASAYPGGEAHMSYDGIDIIRRYSAHTIWLGAWYWYQGWKRENRADIIIDEAGGWPLLSPLYEREVPIYFFTHHIGDSEFDAYPFPIGSLARWVYRWCIARYRNTPTISVSASTRDELIHDFAFPPEKIWVIDNTLELDALDAINIEEKTHDFVFLGRLTRIKRPLDAIRAFARILPRLPTLSRLHIIGNPQDQRYERELHEYCDKNHLSDRVIFHGYLSDEERQEYMRTSRAIIVPSEKEGYGLVVLEANAVGTPAIVYNVPGLSDSTKDDINGKVVPSGDIDILGETMLEMLADRAKYEQLCRSSLEYVKNLPSWDVQYQKLFSLIFSKL